MSTPPAPPVVDGGETTRLERPIEIAGLWIWPRGAAPASPGELGLELDSGGVFGSGLHPTTQLCLERLVEWPPTSLMLDVGTGTGILALAALKLGTERAVLLDLDPRARRVAQENAARNRLEDRAEVAAHGVEAEERRFPLVVANMPSAHLLEIAPALVRCLAPGGRLLVSGIYETQDQEVLRCFRDRGLRAGPSHERGGWLSAELWTSW